MPVLSSTSYLAYCTKALSAAAASKLITQLYRASSPVIKPRLALKKSAPDCFRCCSTPGDRLLEVPVEVGAGGSVDGNGAPVGGGVLGLNQVNPMGPLGVTMALSTLGRGPLKNKMVCAGLVKWYVFSGNPRFAAGFK